jgi:hypothetical protein
MDYGNILRKFNNLKAAGTLISLAEIVSLDSARPTAQVFEMAQKKETSLPAPAPKQEPSPAD